jgi:hypothetical protein
MAARKKAATKKAATKKAATKKAAPLVTGDVDALLASLAHPHENAIVRLRQLVLGAHPSVVEGVKWNAPSFATTEHFATFHLRAKQGVVLVMHFGAKQRAGKRPVIADPAGLLAWVDHQRATITFADLADVEAKRKAFVSVIRSWVAAM